MTYVFPGLPVNNHQPTASTKCKWYQTIPCFEPYKPCKASYLSPPAAMILEILFLLLRCHIPDMNNFIIT